MYGGQSYAGYMYRIYSLHADHYKVIFLILTKKFMEYLHRDIFLCIYMYINVDIDNNNFYFSIVLHAKLMKYMIYKNN